MPNFKGVCLMWFKILIFVLLPGILFGQETIYRKAKNTVTGLEMAVGDTLKFQLKNREVRTIVLLETDAKVLLTNLFELKKDPTRGQGGTLYHFTGKILVDGHPMTLERYVSSQESFYEPYVINGLRIWFDGVSAISDIMLKEHGGKDCECIPGKDARFAFSDMTDDVAPVEFYPWYINNENYIDIADVYNGDDTWMGGYLGVEAHGGLDLNMPAGSPNYAPISIDDHYLFNSLAKGDRNNRWRGVHKWENGDMWTIENMHVLNLLVPEHTPIKAGVHYADAAGVAIGNNEHAHYVFRVKSPDDTAEILLDPWIIFWQTFEQSKRKRGAIDATFAPVSPGLAGSPVSFSSKGSTARMDGKALSFFWTFGDGGWSDKQHPQYTYASPGVYPVTLVVDDGGQRDSFTQHITIDGCDVDTPALTLMAKDEPSFRLRPLPVMDVYGSSVKFLPHSLNFLARASRPRPNVKVVTLENKGARALPRAIKPRITYAQGEGWLSIEHKGKGNDQSLTVGVDATGLSPGAYSATVYVDCEASLNSTQGFLVQLTIPSHPPAHSKTRDLDGEVIDNSDKRYGRFYATPYFWARPHFHLWKEKGYNSKGYDAFYLTNGGRAAAGEFVRFTPDLERGRYEVSFSKETPFDPARRALVKDGQVFVNPEFNPPTRFAVRVKSKHVDKTIWMEPAKSLIIGEFDFEEGMDGFVEILSAGSTGQVLADAVIFKKL